MQAKKHKKMLRLALNMKSDIYNQLFRKILQHQPQSP